MTEYNLLPCPECHRQAQQPEITFASKRKPDFTATVFCSRCRFRRDAEGVTEDGAKDKVAKLWGTLIDQPNDKKDAAAADEIPKEASGNTAEAVGAE